MNRHVDQDVPSQVETEVVERLENLVGSQREDGHPGDYLGQHGEEEKQSGGQVLPQVQGASLGDHRVGGHCPAVGDDGDRYAAVLGVTYDVSRGK